MDYDIESYQVKVNIVNCSDERLKGLKILTYLRRDVGMSDKYVTQL